MTTLRIASWNCAGGFHNKVGAALALDADVYVIQEAEPPDGYAAQLPKGTSTHYTRRPDSPKGVLVFTRPGFSLAGRTANPAAEFAHVVPMTVVSPDGPAVDLFAVWTLDAKPRAAAYVGQAHLALDILEPTMHPRTVMIGDFNSNQCWDSNRRRNHSALVERLEARGMRSAYHEHTGEAQGEETCPTFFLYRDATKPYHLDYCFTDCAVTDVEVGAHADWSGRKSEGGLSDHVPLVVTIDPTAVRSRAES